MNKDVPWSKQVQFVPTSSVPKIVRLVSVPLSELDWISARINPSIAHFFNSEPNSAAALDSELQYWFKMRRSQ